ncbi:hypothetical protein L596_023961 [Steinernema carpocapsae]|uniref:TIMELESS-interacting protein n=1 Tax=Steinernema carpocapsae TaxID=34508 RepID=A0A4U5MFA3_STECR|nr:hypothetical protein L596_023961 [Steinernema carpocapsae]
MDFEDEEQEIGDFFGDVGGSGSEKENEDDVPTDADVLNRIMKKKDAAKARGERKQKNPNPKFGPNEVTGKRGISALYEEFKDFKPNEELDEFENVEAMMKKIEHWGHLLYPRLHFDDFCKKLDVIGQKAAVKLHMRHLRNDTGPYDPESTSTKPSGCSPNST